jgi:hypothetical protein
LLFKNGKWGGGALPESDLRVNYCSKLDILLYLNNSSVPFFHIPKIHIPAVFFFILPLCGNTKCQHGKTAFSMVLSRDRMIQGRVSAVTQQHSAPQSSRDALTTTDKTYSKAYVGIVNSKFNKLIVKKLIQILKR